MSSNQFSEKNRHYKDSYLSMLEDIWIVYCYHKALILSQESVCYLSLLNKQVFYLILFHEKGKSLSCWVYSMSLCNEFNEKNLTFNSTKYPGGLFFSIVVASGNYFYKVVFCGRRLTL